MPCPADPEQHKKVCGTIESGSTLYGNHLLVTSMNTDGVPYYFSRVHPVSNCELAMNELTHACQYLSIALKEYCDTKTSHYKNESWSLHKDL